MIDITSVKLVAAVLYQDRKDFEQIIPELEERFSSIDYLGTFIPFVETDYYESEMGEKLMRGIISFENLVHPSSLAKAKLSTRELEDSIRFEGNRKVNVDIGYMDLFKIVLASFKGRSNKIYLSDEVWADMILYFDAGHYKSFNWGFPDFKSGKYNEDLVKIRTIYRSQLKGQNQ